MQIRSLRKAYGYYSTEFLGLRQFLSGSSDFRAEIEDHLYIDRIEPGQTLVESADWLFSRRADSRTAAGDGVVRTRVGHGLCRSERLAKAGGWSRSGTCRCNGVSVWQAWNDSLTVEKLEGKIEEAIVEDPIFLERRRTPTTDKPTLALDIRERKIQHAGKLPAC
jgi:hypothetical protein